MESCLLNVPPTRDGRLHDVDVARLAAFRGRLDAMLRVGLAAQANGVVAHHRRAARPSSRCGSTGRDECESRATRGADRARAARRALHAAGRVGAEWRELSRGTTIGYTKLDRFPATSVSRVRLTIEDVVDMPERVVLRLFA